MGEGGWARAGSGRATLSQPLVTMGHMNDAEHILIQLAESQHGVFSRHQAVASGLSPSAVSRRLRSGEFKRVASRSLRFAAATVSWRGSLMAGLLDLGDDALVSARASAALLGLDGYDDGPVAFLVPRYQRDRRTRGSVTSSPDITGSDRTLVDGLRCTSATRTVIELLSCASEREIANALDSATRLGLTTPSVVRRRLDQLGTQGRSGVAAFDRVMESAGVQSWLERRFLQLVDAAAIPRPHLQRVYRRDGAHVARVDFDFDPLPIVVEVGGRKGYLSIDERRRQEHRRNELQLLGKTVYFFSTEDVVEDAPYVLGTIRLALTRAA